MRSARTLVLGFVLLVSMPASARVPLPEALRDVGPWQLRGAGDMRVLGWRVYEAALWRRGDTAGHEALAIRYDTTISSERLVSTTLEELERLGLPRPERWQAVLGRAFPDVAPGDVLVAVRSADGVRFYAAGRQTARVPDPAFADAFFGIWLDPRTREPDLRAALLGGVGR
ncbi:hypothetical protein G3580_05140 [Nitrogeniibacter mangrovi]|uniref:Chalcone isomerase domain-containing protein n=1 Tax=Nitrogeniibacter mangrovi TaxID=2016596 RepID=A0A6C1B2M3_9RHOO|nr:chalcone isomerase family protein [Nitrogeniibacter mangrovi]QID17078.1 hypothetical protein G3580_05140 [Nitrogeniibacter mangrovi]